MAMDPMNESYNRCMEELRARYRGRGIATNVKNEAATQNKKENTSLNSATGSYVIFDSRSMIGDRYRSGEYNGSKYMTSDDFVRYFKSRRSFYSMQTVVKTAREAEKGANPAVPARKGSEKGGKAVSSESNSKEGHLRTILSAVKLFADKWFFVEPKEGRMEGARFRMPAAVMSGIAVFTLSLGLIVGGSVMIGSASGEIGRLEGEIAVLEERQADLESKLDLKYDVNEIEAEARNLGMIKREYADNKYIKTEANENVVIYEEEEDAKVGLAALLSAFGIELD